MTKRTRNILIGIVIFLVIVNAVSYIIGRRGGISQNSAGRITTSATSVRINGEPIPSYWFREMVYIAAQDLQLFNFTVEENEDERTCTIENPEKNYTVNDDYMSRLSHIEENTIGSYQDYTTLLDGYEVQGYRAGRYIIIPLNALDNIGRAAKSDSANVIEITLGDNTATAAPEPSSTPSDVSVTPPTVAPVAESTTQQGGRVIVLDPGHGASSGSMSDEEKSAAGWVYNENRGQWGEWRHWKSGTTWQDCGGSGCSGRVPSGGSCWYSIGSGDRDTEPDINLQNCLAAKKYLEEMGYTVRLTRSSNDENPSITERIKNCYPNNDTSAEPDAMAYICVHSNAGGGSGSAYIQLGGSYDQAGIPSNYAEDGNALGKSINDRIVSSTSLGEYSGGTIEGLEALILFCKSPVICGYMEIGFYDNSSDLAILRSESDAIGRAIAEGINDYFGN